MYISFYYYSFYIKLPLVNILALTWPDKNFYIKAPVSMDKFETLKLAAYVQAAHHESLGENLIGARGKFLRAIEIMENDLFSADNILADGVYTSIIEQDMYVNFVLDYVKFLILRLGSYEEALALLNKVEQFDKTLYCENNISGCRAAALFGLGREEEATEQLILSQTTGCLYHKLQAIHDVVYVAPTIETYPAEAILRSIEKLNANELDDEDRQTIAAIRILINKKRTATHHGSGVYQKENSIFMKIVAKLGALFKRS